ncbi:MAG: DMT family transporter [Saprospiraceae bacterium]
MQKQTHFQNILLLNFAMLCISTSGALGRYIDLPPPLTIWWRALFALFFLGIFCLWKKLSFRFDIKKYGFTFFLSGFLMTAHWVTYFYALQWSNVAIGMLSLFTYPVMTALLEPLILKTKFQKHHLILGIIVLIGVSFLAPDLTFENKMTQGLFLGLISALAYSLRNIMLKTQVQNFNGSVLMFYQMMVMLILLFPVLFFYEEKITTDQLPFILFLGLVTTAIGHTLFLNSFRHFSVSTASILSGMQPIYGILIAVIFLSEIPAWRNWIGGFLIISTVILESFFNKKSRNEQS